MAALHKLAFLILTMSLAISCRPLGESRVTSATKPLGSWSQLPPLPDRLGLGGPLAGVSGGALLIGGGANFPDKMPWNGGVKVWHDTVYALNKPDSAWGVAGRLPRPLGYGACVSADDAVLCFGGSDAQRHYADGFRLQIRGDAVSVTPLPSLPKPCANMTWALADRTLFVLGGIERPDSVECLNSFWALDLNHLSAGWRELPPCPGPARMLAVSGTAGSDFLLFSGASLSAGADGKPKREYLRDAWRYAPGKRWKRLAEMPRSAVAAPSPAAAAEGRVFIVSGDDGSLVNFEPKSKHPGFPKSLLAYDPARDTWTDLGESPLSRATAPVVEWHGRFVIASGEVRPGVRTPEIWTFRANP